MSGLMQKVSWKVPLENNSEVGAQNVQLDGGLQVRAWYQTVRHSSRSDNSVQQNTSHTGAFWRLLRVHLTDWCKHEVPMSQIIKKKILPNVKLDIRAGLCRSVGLSV
jgi:hypothetical protein